MKKALHRPCEGLEQIKNSLAHRQGHIVIPFIINQSGDLTFRNTGDVEFLLRTVNDYLRNSQKIDKTFQSEFGHSLSIWLGHLLSKGFTSHMLHNLRKDLRQIRFYHILNPPIPSRQRPLPHWNYVAAADDFSNPRTLAAYAFAQQLTLDGFSGLKRCELNSCRHYFIGRPNAKWCSKPCGSLHRVRQKRRKDRI